MRRLLAAFGILFGALFSQSAFANSCASPPSSINVMASATGAAATVTATLTGVSQSNAYLTGVTISGNNATAGTVVDATITGLAGGTMHIAVPVGTLTALQGIVNLNFENCPLPATGSTITISVPTFGSGNPASSVILRGY